MTTSSSQPPAYTVASLTPFGTQNKFLTMQPMEENGEKGEKWEEKGGKEGGRLTVMRDLH